jgi:hybrid cluster-associated redox disulfide protein
MTITKDMTIGEVLRANPKAVQILMSFGMGCVGCPSAQAETVEEAAGVHGLNVEEIINALNA